MREEVISSNAVAVARSNSPPQTPAASSAGATSPPASANNITSTDWHGSVHGSKAVSLSCIGSQPLRTSLSTNAGGSTLGTYGPSCRPWERGDLLRRLATFKPTNWFAKPKGASSLSCARRGWINTDKDIIECESCGMQLCFTAAASWTAVEVDRAGEAFADQLDAGHKVACPWRGNSCADSLAQFPPTPPSALIGGYKDRCDGLLQFFSLPVIASSAIEAMRLTRGPQIDRFLSLQHELYSGELGSKANSKPGVKPSRDLAICTYSLAQKLISLCGWEPRWLPNIHDCEENSAESAKNACSVGPTQDEASGFHTVKKSEFSVSAKKDKGKGKVFDKEFKCDTRSPLLDCSLCGATVPVWDFRTVTRPDRFVANGTDAPDAGKRLTLTRGISAASGINGWVAQEIVEREQLEGRDEAATNDEGRSLYDASLDLNLTMAGGLPSAQSGMPVMSGHFDDGGMGRDLNIGQPAGSEVGDRAASYESRGPSTRKRNLEQGGSTVDRPQDRIQPVDSIEGTVIDREGEEVDDGTQESDGPSKRARGFDIFDRYHSSYPRDSSGAGPSRNINFDIDIAVNRVGSFKEDNDVAIGLPSARDSTRASSVIAMDTIYSSEDESMESVENFPGNDNYNHVPSPNVHRNIDINDALDSNNSNPPAQQSANVQPPGGSVAREMGGSSTNEGEEIVNMETVKVYPRDRLSLGISGGSVGMGASHEAEIHGVEVSVHRTESVVGDAEPVADVTENLGQTGESAPGPGLMDEFVPEEAIMQDQGDSQEEMFRAIGRGDSGSKVCGSTKADSVESGEKVSYNIGHDSTPHPSMSCNAVINSAYEASKEEVTQTGKMASRDDLALADSGYAPLNEIGIINGENEFEAEAGDFDPIKHHNSYCPWVNGNVAAAGCNSDSGSSSSNSGVPCGWELTLDALDTYHALGHVPNQTMQSESAASLYKDDHVPPRQKLLTRHSASRIQGKQ